MTKVYKLYDVFLNNAIYHHSVDIQALAFFVAIITAVEFYSENSSFDFHSKIFRGYLCKIKEVLDRQILQEHNLENKRKYAF